MRFLRWGRASCGARKGCSERVRSSCERIGASGRRSVVACLVVFCLIGAVCASRFLEHAAEPVIRQAKATGSQSVGYSAVIDGASDPYEFAASSRPDAFADEVVSLEGRSDGRIDEQARTIGWSCEGEVSEVFSSTATELKQKGWKQMESGQAACASFTKGSGCYRWAFVACAQVGSSVSVVVQVS